jgi:parvulin-like peptidyl-prolyl isomerase
MRSHGLRGLSLVASLLLLGGCQSSRPSWEAVEPDLTVLLAKASPAQARGQKDEKPAPKGSVLDLGPDAPGASREGRVARIRAVVNSMPILEEEVLAAAAQALAGVRSEKEKAEVLNQKLDELIDREVVVQDAIAKLSSGPGSHYLTELKAAAHEEFDKQWMQKMMKGNGYTDEEAFKRFLRANNMPFDLIKRQWERNFIAMEYMRYRIQAHVTRIGHLQIQDYYDKHPEEFKIADSVDWQDLLISAAKHPTRLAARQFAEVLAARVRKGEDFARLSREFGNGVCSLQEGSPGKGSKRGEIDPREAEATLFRMSDGEVALVETEAGFHVVRLRKRVQAGQRPFDKEVQKEIQDKLRGQIFQREMKRIVKDLRRRAVIEVAQTIH